MEGPRTRLRLRVAPRAERASVVGRYGAGWKVRVAAEPEQGHANDAVVALLADALEVGRPEVRIVAGATGMDKLVELSGLSAEDADRRLAAAGTSGRG
jgi:uncharacterized protein